MVVAQKMYITILVLLILILVMVLQAGHLTREYIKIGKGALDIRIAFISDLHMGLLMVSEKDAARALKEEAPDLLIIAGDIIDKENHIGEFAKWIKRVSPGCPVFVTLGNHDHDCFKKYPLSRELFFFNLQSLGVELLVNSSAIFYKGGKSINIIGIDDYRCGSPDVKKAFALKDKTADFTVAVSHNPETALSIPAKAADLFLCGHFHGGQIWMPFSLEYRLLRKEKTSKAGFRKGLHTIDGTLSYISRGIGNVVFPFRLGSLPEITFIDL